MITCFFHVLYCVNFFVYFDQTAQFGQRLPVDKKESRSALIFDPLILVIVILIVWIFVQHREKCAERKKTLKAMADKLGFAFKENDAVFLRVIRKSHYFSKYHPADTLNCLSKNDEDVELRIADCHFSKDGTACVATICLIIDYRMNLPGFYIRRQESHFSVIAQLLEKQDINFEDDQAFSEAFVLQGQDEISLKYLFNREVRNFLMRYAGSSAEIEGHGSTLLFHKGRLEWPSDFENLGREALELCRLLKKTVEKEEL